MTFGAVRLLVPSFGASAATAWSPGDCLQGHSMRAHHSRRAGVAGRGEHELLAGWPVQSMLRKREAGMTEAETVHPGQGEALSVRDSTLLFKATTLNTGGAFSLHERRVPAGGLRPPAHVHPDRVEAFWVLDGVAEFVLDGRLSRASAGSFVLVPGGVSHTFGASEDSAAHLLVLHAPALDEYFRELAELWSGEAPPARDIELELMRRHGMRPV